MAKVRATQAVVARRAGGSRELGNLEISKWIVIKKFFLTGSDLSDKLDWSELSKGNGKERKRAERVFDEKRV